MRLALALVVLAYAASRVALCWSVSPFFDVDTYKYLSGADSLWAGHGWSPIYLHRHDGGGALHAVPGYPWFLLAVWGAAGGITFTGVALAQAAVSTLALVATADLVRRYYGPRVALLAAALLAASPTLAWLDHFLMPESLSASLTTLALWLAARSGTFTSGTLTQGTLTSGTLSRALSRKVAKREILEIDVPKPTVPEVDVPKANVPKVSVPEVNVPEVSVPIAAIGAGGVVGLVVLLRTSAQVFVPFPLLVAAGCLRRVRSVVVWGVVYVAALVAGVMPWVVHNRDVHGHAVLTASTGRSLYFASVWSDATLREQQMSRLGPGRPTDVNAAFYLLDAQYQAFLDRGMDLVEADAAMRRLAIEEMRAAGLRRFLEARAATVEGLFETHAFGRKNNTLTEMVSWYLTDGGGREPVLGNMQKRWGYQLTPAALAAIDETHRTHASPAPWFRWWVEHFSFDNLPLAAAFLASTLVLVAQPRRSAFALACWAAPVYAYLAMFSLFGTPLYRYQAVLHGPMLVTIAIALGELAAFTLRRRPRARATQSAA